LVGPEYVRVDVECEITVVDPETANDVELAARSALDQYLNPLTGGDEGAGWDFGRAPKRSDLFGPLVGIAGVSHVRELRISLVPDRPGSENTDLFLICCGKHKISTTLED